MKLQTRILLAQLPALVVIGVLFVWGGRTVNRLGVESQRIAAENYRSVLAAEEMQAAIARLETAEILRAGGNPTEAERIRTEQGPRFVAALRLEESNLTEVGEEVAAAELRAAWERFEATTGGSTEEPGYLGRVATEAEAVRAAAVRVLTLNNDALLRKSDAAAASAEAAEDAWLAWSAVGLLGAVTLGVVVANRLTGPLRALSQTAAEVGEGNLDVRLPHTHIAELDAVTSAFNTMAERLRLYRRANDTELARARESAQAAIESLGDPVLVLTLRGELRACNGAARRLLRLPAGARRVDGSDPAIVEAVEAAHAGVVEGGRALAPADFSGVVVVAHPDGEHALLPLATPINDAVTGELVGVTVLLQDVTRLRRLDELKGNLVQTVAHELRTPLTSLGMALHLALDERVSGVLPARLADLLATAREDALRLRRLVEDLLDLSRIQEGRVTLRCEAVGVAGLLDETREALRSAAETAQVTVTIEVGSGAELVQADHARLQLGLGNLLANALRHTPPQGRVWLRGLARPGGVRFEVEDTGPGVAAVDRARIFDAFVRGPGAEGPGAGLGLYIAREVARAHGGRIGVEEAPGGGARFWLEIPEAPQPGQAGG